MSAGRADGLAPFAIVHGDNGRDLAISYGHRPDGLTAVRLTMWESPMDLSPAAALSLARTLKRSARLALEVTP